METYLIRISGKVQGVWFRAKTQEIGMDLKLGGTVRNIESGEVEIMVSGKRALLLQFIDFILDGPPLARVDEIYIKKHQLTEFENFTIVK